MVAILKRPDTPAERKETDWRQIIGMNINSASAPANT